MWTFRECEGNEPDNVGCDGLVYIVYASCQCCVENSQACAINRTDLQPTALPREVNIDGFSKTGCKTSK